MTIDPRLGAVERIGSAAMGAGLAVYAFVGDFEQVWIRAVLVAVGVAFVVGGIGGT